MELPLLVLGACAVCHCFTRPVTVFTSGLFYLQRLPVPGLEAHHRAVFIDQLGIVLPVEPHMVGIFLRHQPRSI